MKWEITKGDAFPLLRVVLEKGEEIKAESGAMVAMSDTLQLTGKMDGGLLKAMARKFSGESFFMQNISAESGAGWALLAPPMPGVILPVEIAQGKSFLVKKDGYLAGTMGIDVSTKTQGLVRGIFGGEGLFIVKLGGEGTAFLSAYGSAHVIDVPAGQSVLIDNGNMIAWDADMKYDVVKLASSWISAVTAGSGLGCRFHGPGQAIVQTRNPNGLGAWMYDFLPPPPETR